MEYKKLGTLNPSSVILGTDHFGTNRTREESFAIMDAYFAAGGNVLDTARVYGALFDGSDGASEACIGEYIKSRKNRSNVIVSSKAAHPTLGDIRRSRLSAQEIEADIDKSLSILGIDYIDLLWLHRDDTSIPVDDIIDTLNNMQKKGKILFFGASNWTAERIATANEYAKKSNQNGFCASQIQYSLAVCAKIDDDTLVKMNSNEENFYRRTKMPVFAFSSQSKGFFEKLDKNALSEKAYNRYYCDENLETYRKLKPISEKYQLSLSALSLGWLLQNPDFTVFPIVGASSVAQLRDSLSIFDKPIPKELRDIK